MSIKVKALTDQYCWYVATEDGTILATPTTLTELHEAVEGLVDVEVDTSGGFAYSESLINSLKNAAKAGTAWVKPLADGAFGVTTYDWSIIKCSISLISPWQSQRGKMCAGTGPKSARSRSASKQFATRSSSRTSRSRSSGAYP
jgi:hypothetical protein